MTISGNDLVYVLSGGSTNTVPANSLGGDPSSQIILGTVDNLFPDVTQAQVNTGYIDYLCFYIFNDSNTDTLYNSSLYIVNVVSGGSTIAVGLTTGNAVQMVSVLGTVTGGSFSVQYEAYTPIVVNWNADAAQWANNFQTQLQTLPNLQNVTVTASVFNNAVQFQVNFLGVAGGRFQPTLEITANNLTGTSISITVLALSSGGPINYIAQIIPVTTTKPAGILFTTPTVNSPILIGNMLPGDGIAVWVQRTTPVAITPLANDGFTIRLAGFATQ